MSETTISGDPMERLAALYPEAEPFFDLLHGDESEIEAAAAVIAARVRQAKTAGESTSPDADVTQADAARAKTEAVEAGDFGAFLRAAEAEAEAEANVIDDGRAFDPDKAEQPKLGMKLAKPTVPMLGRTEYRDEPDRDRVKRAVTGAQTGELDYAEAMSEFLRAHLAAGDDDA